MSKYQAIGHAKIEVEAWANVPEGRDPDEFANYLRSLGNTVREYDPENRRWRLAFGPDTAGA